MRPDQPSSRGPHVAAARTRCITLLFFAGVILLAVFLRSPARRRDTLEVLRLILDCFGPAAILSASVNGGNPGAHAPSPLAPAIPDAGSRSGGGLV